MGFFSIGALVVTEVIALRIPLNLTSFSRMNESVFIMSSNDTIDTSRNSSNITSGQYMTADRNDSLAADTVTFKQMEGMNTTVNNQVKSEDDTNQATVKSITPKKNLRRKQSNPNHQHGGAAFIHVGKTGGSSLSLQLRNGCHSFVKKPCHHVQNETIVSELVTDYYHSKFSIHVVNEVDDTA